MTINELLVKFREDYRAAQPAEVRDIMAGVPDNDFGALANKALELEGRGFRIDLQIDLWRWEPLWVHAARSVGGIASVGSFNGSDAGPFPTVAVDYADPEGSLERLHHLYPLPPPPPPQPPANPGMIGVPFGFKAVVDASHQLRADEGGAPVWQCLPLGYPVADGTIENINGKAYRKFIQGGENISHQALHLWLGPMGA